MVNQTKRDRAQPAEADQQTGDSQGGASANENGAPVERRRLGLRKPAEGVSQDGAPREERRGLRSRFLQGGLKPAQPKSREATGGEASARPARSAASYPLSREDEARRQERRAPRGGEGERRARRFDAKAPGEGRRRDERPEFRGERRADERGDKRSEGRPERHERAPREGERRFDDRPRRTPEQGTDRRREFSGPRGSDARSEGRRDARPTTPYGERPPRDGRRNEDGRRDFRRDGAPERGPRPPRAQQDDGRRERRTPEGGAGRPERGAWQSEDRNRGRERSERPPRTERNERSERSPRGPRGEGERRPARPAQLSAAEGVRLSKLMAEQGLCSRREADAIIERGWVFVDGQRVTELGTRVAPTAKIELAPEAEQRQARQVTILLHKPVGYVSGQPEDGYEAAVSLIGEENQFDRETATPFHYSHLRGLAPAGRLDIDSTGLLVLTQNGRIARQLIGEDSQTDKEYLVRVEGSLTEEGLALLNHGLELDGHQLRPAKVEWVNDDQLRFELREGRKRQIRRMCELVGLKVVGLKRVRIGKVRLADLPLGEWRFLREDEQF